MKKTINKILKKIIRSIYLLQNDGYTPIADNGFWKFRSNPTKSLHKTAALFNQIQGETIIEIGTGLHGSMSGNSMLVWTKNTVAKRIIAIDLEQSRLDEISTITTHNTEIELVLGDGVEYLHHFRGKIDLLYLDFWTPDPEGSIIGTGRAEAYYDAFKAAKDKMSTHSMVLIDDTDHISPWKHSYIIPLARKNGYRVLYTGRQTLLQR